MYRQDVPVHLRLIFESLSAFWALGKSNLDMHGIDMVPKVCTVNELSIAHFTLKISLLQVYSSNMSSGIMFPGKLGAADLTC
mmetsp:Transcript_23305/g.92798  ORF Transcript_23305/g.92798 Transcript_23305/m.92798 type:complete len:82 (-) Transcript_23305:56-301(-)